MYELRCHFPSSSDFSTVTIKWAVWCLQCLLAPNRDNPPQLTQCRWRCCGDSGWLILRRRSPPEATCLSDSHLFWMAQSGNQGPSWKTRDYRVEKLRLHCVEAGTNQTLQGQCEPTTGNSAQSSKRPWWQGWGGVTNKHPASVFCTQHWNPGKKSSSFADVESALLSFYFLGPNHQLLENCWPTRCSSGQLDHNEPFPEVTHVI